MDYKITTITGDYEAQFGKRRVVFKVEGNDNTISGFFKFPPKVGDTIHGQIVQKDQYWNFKFDEKTHETPATGYTPTGDLLRLERKVDALMTEIQMIRGVLGEILQKVKPILDEPQF